MSIAVTGSTGRLGRPGRPPPRRRRASRSGWSSATRHRPRAARRRRRAARYGDDDAAVRRARGVETLFMVSGAEEPDRVAQHRAFVDAAAAAGVRHLVYISFFGAAPDATFTLARDHWATEEHIRASGLALHVPARQPLPRLLPAASPARTA